MVVLERIKRNKGKITCEAYVEDSKVPVMLSLDENVGRMASDELPKGYEYCTSHLKHAERFLKTLIGAESVPAKRTIMWY